jgi:hypothetical protein
MTPKDRSFLIEFRDYLATAANPATSSTIAFSSLTSEFEKARAAGEKLSAGKPTGGVFDEIDVAFPRYSKLAARFRARVQWIGWAAIMLTVAVGLLSGYIYWGSLILGHLGEVQAKADKLASDRGNEEQVLEERAKAILQAQNAKDPQAPVDLTKAPRVRDCVVFPPSINGELVNAIGYSDEDPYGRFLMFTSIKYGQICASLADIDKEFQATGSQLNAFTSAYGVVSRIAHPQTMEIWRQDEIKTRKLQALAIVAFVNGYFTTLLMGGLGAAAFILRSYLFALAAKTLHPRDLRAYVIRIVLGIIAGLAVGFFMSPGTALDERTKGLDGAVSLTGPALAFLAGYAVEVLFGFLDSVARMVFPTQK